MFMSKNILDAFLCITVENYSIPSSSLKIQVKLWLLELQISLNCMQKILSSFISANTRNCSKVIDRATSIYFLFYSRIAIEQ